MNETSGRNKTQSFLIILCLLAVGIFYLGLPQWVQAQGEAGWKDRWEKVLSGAKKEGKVVVFGPGGAAIRKAVTSGFKKAFPDISIEYAGGRGGRLAAKIKAERDGGIYSVDVILQGTTTALVYFKPMGALDPIGPVLVLPEVKLGKYWRNGRLEFSDAKRSLNLVFSTNVKAPVVFNLNQAKVNELDELHELIDPKWKGKFIINDPVPSGSGGVTFRHIWQALGPKKALEYYRNIRANAGIVDRNERRQIEWVAQGKYAFVLGGSDRMVRQLKGRGLKFGVLSEFKDHGSYITPGPGSVLLINKAPHRNAATVFINWLLSKEGQTAWSKASGYTSRRVDVSTAHLAPYVIPKPGSKYSSFYQEKNIKRSAEEEEILKELFAR